MRLSTWFPVLAALFITVQGLSSTDSPQDGDVSQSGYSTTHNFDPAQLNNYKLRWKYNTGVVSETFYAKPLVYTPNGAPYERIYIVSDMNTVGIIGTPIIDPATDIMYFWSKSYKNGQVGPMGVPTVGADNSQTGVANGAWNLYAVNLADLSDAPGFPVPIEGLTARNDPARYILSGTLNQRPGLAMLGNTIITAFGSHCDNFNFTGFLITASKTPGVGVTDIQAMVASPGAPNPQALDLTRQNNGKSGIWQAGMGLAVDTTKKQVFFAVGNGQGKGQLLGDNGGPVAAQGNYLSTLENAVVSYNVNPDTGRVTQSDWFVTEPYDHLNGEDKDVGSSGVALLDPAVFSGGGVQRIAIAAGKIGTVYIMDADNLGGYKMSPSQDDNVLQEIVFNPDDHAFFSGVASYPLEGGYIYFAPTSGSIYAYKFGIVDGKPQFTFAGQTTMIFAGKGAPRVTSFNGQPGTGIVWIADVNQGIQAFHAIPDANQVLQPYSLPPVGRLTKFHRPQFGNGTIYSVSLNNILAVGPVAGAAASSSAAATTKKTTSATTMTTATSKTSSSSSTIVVSLSSTTKSSSSVFTSSSTSSTSSSTSITKTSTSSSSSTAGTISFSSATTTPSGPTPTGAFGYIGCYQDTSTSHALPLLFANTSVTPELCEAYVSSLASKPVPTIYNYYYLEYHQECYGGNTFNFQGSAISSLTGTKACTAVCSGSVGAASTGTAKCGGSKQFNLYAKGGPAGLPAGWPGATTTATGSSKLSSSSTSTPTMTSAPTSISTPTTTLTTSSSTTSSTISSSSSSSTSKPFPSSVSSMTSTSSATTSTPPAYVTPIPPTGPRVNINWNLTWINAAPDGFQRPVIAINGQWPNPPIVLNYGDQMVLTVYNGLGNESTAIHFHGLQQRNTTYADGPSFVTQCPVPPGETIVYQFQARQLGTYWYHAHHAGQYIDGLRGAFIVKDPSAPYGRVDQDFTLTLTDFYHEEAPDLIHYYQSAENFYDTGGSEPLPDAALINEAQNVKYTLKPGQKNLFRVINMGAMAAHYLQFDGHSMTIVEVDGQYVQPYTVQQLFVAVAQRYTVIVTSKADAGSNFAIVATMNTAMFGESGSSINPSVSGWLVYDETLPLPAPFTLKPLPWNDLAMVPLDQLIAYGSPTTTLYYAADFSADSNGIPRANLNGNAYLPPNVPTLYTALTAPAQYLNNPAIYGTATNPTVLPYGAIVEIQIDNHDDRAHPFHLHGHHFQVIYRGSGGSLFPGLEGESAPTLPLRRDTIVVYPDNTATIRFVADNPGIQLFHCHTEWHVIGGMTATFIEAPTELVAQKPYIPGTHRDICDKHGILRKGNAAGNSKNWLDLKGAPTTAPTSNWGALVNPPTS